MPIHFALNGEMIQNAKKVYLSQINKHFLTSMCYAQF